MSQRAAVFMAMVVCFAGFGGGLTGCGYSGPIAETGGTTTDVNALTQGLSNEAARVRIISARRLGELGAEADPAVPKLQELANNDPDEGVRKIAAEAVQKIQGGE